MRIGELSRRTGVSTRLLRYYEEQGLLHPDRKSNGYRTYAEGSVERVEQIRDLLQAGLSTQTIREIVPCFIGTGAQMRPMVHPVLAANLAHELAEIQRRIDVLVRNRDAIRAYVEAAGRPDSTQVTGPGRMPCELPTNAEDHTGTWAH
ncbi:MULTISPECIES: MerR family transcriptional regulator [Streptomyces]|uniref:MerR family transcriptional regulator n=1 Tax=Streptomyces TaxID=1883 RepID=UPI0019660EF0|nr:MULTISPECIES: MerR family transcriptional regulator [Streptomyces]QRX93039.1 MerR family transcriptional regulator [Streptomyces noursei]UJB42751.1 MerR family transcriptional regulator [Streptomyces sp. A1-5]